VEFGLFVGFGAAVLALAWLLIAAPAVRRRRDAGMPPVLARASLRERHPGRLPVRVFAPLLALAPVGLLVGWWFRGADGAWDLGWRTTLACWLLTLVWLPVTGRWTAGAHASWSLGVTVSVIYLVVMAAWTVNSGLPVWAMFGAWVLWSLEVCAVLLFLAHGWELHDALGSRFWRRRLPAVPAVATAAERFVSVHVPSHNEPPEVLLETLESLRGLDWAAYEVLVIDNNTSDDELWEPVRAYCERHPEIFRFHRLVDWPGYKSGALNYALTQCDPRTELVAVVDADYRVEPDWLRAVVGVFDDPHVGFVQTPQHYREWEHAQYLRSLYYSYDYFFAVSQPSRDERGAAIFGGTMGLVRRDALVDVGGWDEWCITEDAELSLRLLAAGWTGHHLDRPFGAGIMPLTFEALKRQRFRWCFGGMQILRRHWRTLMPWRRGPMRIRQRVGYLVGGIQWLGDLLGLVFALVLVASLIDLAGGGGHAVRRVGGLLLAVVPALAGLGFVRAVAGIRAAGDGARWRDAIGAFAIWLSLGWVVAVASVRGLVERQGVFLRTPKLREDVSWADGIRANLTEVGFAVVAVAASVAALVAAPGWTSIVLSSLLVVPVFGWLAAPVHSIAAMRTELPGQLVRRREREDRLAWLGPTARWSAALVGAAAGVLAVAYAVVQPASPAVPGTSSAAGVPARVLPTASPSSPGSASTATTSPGTPVTTSVPGASVTSRAAATSTSAGSPSSTTAVAPRTTVAPSTGPGGGVTPSTTTPPGPPGLSRSPTRTAPPHPTAPGAP